MGLVCPHCGAPYPEEVMYTPMPEHGEREYGFTCQRCGRFAWALAEGDC